MDNIKRIQESAQELQQLRDSISRLLALESKLGTFEGKLDMVSSLSTKLDVIYPVIIKALMEGRLFNHGNAD